MENNNECPKFINDFENYMFSIKNCSEVYIDNIKATIIQFLKFANSHIFGNKYESINDMSINDIRFLSNSDIYSFIFYLAENHYKLGSRLTKINHLSVFFDFLYRIKNTLFKEPFKQINREKRINKQLPNYLSTAEAKNLSTKFADSNNKKDIRTNAMINIFLNCGLRRSELTTMKISDINLKEDTFRIIGKGNKERMCYLNSVAKTALVKYLEERKNIIPNNKKDKDILFLSNHKNAFSLSQIDRVIKRAYKECGIDDKNYGVHTLRHTCATLLHKSGVNIKVIKELLGHVEINTTQIYTHIYNPQIKETMRTHPLAKFKMADALNYCENIA